MIVWYSLTLLLSSMLLFLVQPMVARMILPALGGTPAVWNTCMVFFQAVLLLGYAYAHGSVAWLGTRRQAVVHVILLLVVLFLLPFSVGDGTTPPAEGNPVPWLLWQLLLSIGLPFFLVSSSAPLLQRWFAGTSHPDAGDPYFLYGASNLGSLVALLAYPSLVEPNLWLSEQSGLWTGGYAFLIAMTCGCAVWARCRSVAVSTAVPSAHSAILTLDSTGTPGPGLRRRLWWALLAFVPSSLMLGVTTHLTTDIAAVPLLWVLPLATYLLTFVLAFSRRQRFSLPFLSVALPLVAMALVLWSPLLTGFGGSLGWFFVPFHLFVFFVMAMVCHGRLAQSRPPVTHLTQFYLWMSIGGVAGGAFNGILAPLLFSGVFEYPLMMVAACMLCVPRKRADTDQRAAFKNDLARPALLGVIMYGFVLLLGVVEPQTPQAINVFSVPYALRVLGFLLPAVVAFTFRKRPIRFGLGFAVALAFMPYFFPIVEGHIVHRERNFFGVKRVRFEQNGELHRLIHGSTAHGIQNASPAREREPLGYYHRLGPIGDVFSAVVGSDPQARVAVVGLGTGATAAYARAGQHFTFYEIDPAVARLAEDPRFFTYLRNCEGTYDLVLGDGRLRLTEAASGEFRLIILDAFSSDAIPVHLLSREALTTYLDKMRPGGVIAFHISNRYVDLASVLGNLARDAGLKCLIRIDGALSAEQKKAGRWAAAYVVMARSAESIAELIDNPNWRLLEGEPETRVWSDQYCNIWGVFRWR